MNYKNFSWEGAKEFIDLADRTDVSYRRNRNLLFASFREAIDEDGTVAVPSVLFRSIKSGLCCKQERFDNDRELNLLTAIEDFTAIFEEVEIPRLVESQGSHQSPRRSPFPRRPQKEQKARSPSPEEKGLNPLV